MIRNLKALGLALVAVFALSAMAASAASAHTFTAESAPVTLHGTGENTQVFTVTGHSVECTTASFHGTQANTSATVVTVHPTYSGCAFGGVGVNVTVPANCNFIFHSNTPTANMAPVDIECEHGEPIKIEVGEICTITVGDTHPPTTGPTLNQNLSGVKYINVPGNGGNTREVTVEATVENITAVVHGPLCFLGGISTGTHTDATYFGKAKLTGTEDNGGTGRIGVFFDEP